MGKRRIWLSCLGSRDGQKSFQVCSTSPMDPDKVRNGAFFKQCMGKALHNLEVDDANEIDNDPFELYD